MLGSRWRVEPAPACDLSAAQEASQLELQLQRQLEEDVARIFDESIYSDVEVVCGKLKILTHSCILKARTNNFYHKLETILHVNIGRNTFDEIYSFVSDVYTECNIKHQEDEIITYLDDNLNDKLIVLKSSSTDFQGNKNEIEDSDVFLTPKCVSPYVEKDLPKALNASPSTEITKEYYALVPIDGNLLEKELIEQDALSNAFQSIFKIQSDDLNKVKGIQRNKPTSLSLNSSHLSKIVKHSNSCDILNYHRKDNNLQSKELQINKLINNQESENSDKSAKKSSCETVTEKFVDLTYSPDSLITDDPSSSSDYLSAAYICSPGVNSSGGISLINIDEDLTKMENIFTSSDSGLENTGLLESLSSHKDVTLTDTSLTESTLHDLTADESKDLVSSSAADKNKCKFKHNFQPTASTTTTSENGHSNIESISIKETSNCKSSKEEKQRQNEEIVILESSSLSSETGSWESVFPPLLAHKELCKKNICNEQQLTVEETSKLPNKDIQNFKEDLCPSLVQKSPFKSNLCFIDAACLADEEDTINVQIDTNETSKNYVSSDLLPAPSQPVPCSTAKLDSSPNDLSESNDNDDSLEQGDNKDPDSIQKDLSPTIFDMTPITEDSLCANFENALQAETTKEQSKEMKHVPNTTSEMATSILSNSSVFLSATPHNSIMSLKCSGPKHYESEESESDRTIVGREGHTVLKKNIMKFYESSPIVSGGASIEDHLPKTSSINGSPSTRRKVENIPIVCGTLINQSEDHSCNKSPKPLCPPAWVVDMSCDKHDSIKNCSTSSTMSTTKPCDKSSDYVNNSSKVSLDSIRSFENVNKSRSSVDSDGSEKSSHKFYIDLASLPDPVPPKKYHESESSEKKNIFSMYIDLGENLNVKEMPARLNSRKPVVDTKSTSKSNKHVKTISSECSSAASTKFFDIVTSTCTFEKYESLCNDPNINISEIIHIADSDDISDVQKVHCETKNEKSEIMSSGLPGNKSQQRYKKASVKDDLVISEPSNLFVKLSDLDKPVQKPETIAVISEDKVLDIRMTRSIPENNWGDHNDPSSLRSMEVISSFHSENALSLNRLFPHLKNEFSRSMPGSLSGRTRSSLRLGTSSSPGDLEEQASDISEISSVQSSICRSVIEHSTTEETSQTSSLIGNCQSRLGQDLLRMFLEEIAPDVIVEVSGRRIKAHKCILSSRCQYFAGILSGGWVESAGNVIVLPPFSFNVVHFALCHIYSGVSTIPDSISIVELATIADMLGLEGLKEAIMFTLKAKYCHHFHRPCQVCTAGVLECFPLSSVYGLDDLYRKCLKWITKYFSKVWPTKAFATLPKELLDKCYQQHIINLSTENLADTVYGCGITVGSLQNSRWAESVARMCRRLVNAAAHYAAPRLTAVLQAIAPLPPDAPPPAKQALDDCLAAALEWAPPDEACRAYAYLSALVKDLRSQNYAKPDLISNGNQNKTAGQHNLMYTDACSWRMQCEGALVRAAPRVVGTQAFKELPVDLRKRLRELGCIMYGAQAVPITSSPLQDRKCRSTYHKSKSSSQNSSTTRSLDIDHVRASFVPYAPKPAPQISSAHVLKSHNDLIEKKIKGVNPPKIRTTKAQEERAKFNLSKNNQSQDRLHNKSIPIRMSFENTKPRYLEPKIIKDGEKRIYAAQKNIPKIVSSSESSRNSSPIQARRRQQANASKVQAMSQDSLATSSRPRTAEPSTDSLSESQNSNKYATYTKTKHTTKGSIESVNSTQNSNAQQQSTNHKLKTKIPVYLNQGAKRLPRNNEVATDLKNVTAPTRARTNDRKVTGSLMSATQSSSAKMVPKIRKEPVSNKSAPRCTKKPAGNMKGHSEVSKPPDIPVMERSGTFLKDEPTFGDKTTKIDIDEK